MHQLNDEDLNLYDDTLSFQNFNETRVFLKKQIVSGNEIRFLCTNIRSLRKYWDNLRIEIDKIINEVDFIVLTEINLRKEETNLYGIPGFANKFKCRSDGRGGGGLAIFYRDSWNVDEIEIEFKSAEMMCIEINNNRKQMILVAFYRPPNQNVNLFNEELEYFLSLERIKNGKNIVMMGDINICYMSGMYGSDDYLSVLYSNCLYNTIQKATREELYDNVLVSKCLDHVNVKLHDDCSFSSFVIENKIADHYWIGLKVVMNNDSYVHTENIDDCKSIILNRRVNYFIQNENWWPILDITDPSEIYNEILNKFANIYEKSTIKVKFNRRKTENPWFNDSIKNLIDRKEYIWSRLKKDKYNLELRDQFKKIRNEVTFKIRNEKRLYYHRIFSDNLNDSKKTWEAINQFINKKKKPTILDAMKSSFQIDEDHQMSNLLEGFKSCFKESVEKINHEMNGELFDLTGKFEEGNYTIGDKMSMHLRKINQELLIKAVNKLNHKSSAGPDKIRPQDIKFNLFYLKLILMHLIERIVDTGNIPQLMKVTYLRPIFKKGSRKSLESYRPVGSVSAIMKILEHYLCMQLQQYLDKHNILNNSQYGFVNKKSTIDLLERMTNDINCALNDNKFVIAVATDLSKAFDLVNYKIMLSKLKLIGIGGKLLRIFEDYFRNRKLHVIIGRSISSGYDQSCGLIQGSIISPTLFNIYVNDLASLTFKGRIVQYADDNLLYVIHTDLQIGLRNMQQDMNMVVKYFYNNSIKMNAQKTQMIVFKNHRINVNIYNFLNVVCHETECLRDNRIGCNCQRLPFNDSIKHLGINFDSDMRFNTHIDQMTRTMKVALYKCSRISHYFPVNTKRIIYFSMIQSIINYGITVYSLAPQYIKLSLENTMRRIIQTLFNGIERNLLGILSLDSLAKYHDLSRNYFKEEYRVLNEIGYGLRQRNYRVQRFNNIYGKSLPNNRIPGLLNSLPIELRNLERKGEAKRKLKAYFMRINNE